MTGENDEPVEDYFARLNIEGKRTTSVENRAKINYVYRKVEKFLTKARTARACEVGFGEGYLLRLLKKMV